MKKRGNQYTLISSYYLIWLYIGGRVNGKPLLAYFDSKSIAFKYPSKPSPAMLAIAASAI